MDNHSAFGRSRVALGSFKTEQEAKNFFNYCKTYFVRYLFLMTSESLTSLGKRVIDFLDYSDKNALLDFHNSLDDQLFKMCELNQDEVKLIIDTVDNIRNDYNNSEED